MNVPRSIPTRLTTWLAGLLVALGGFLAQSPSEPGTTDDIQHRERLATWVETLRAEGARRSDADPGTFAVRAAELALGSPYFAYTLEEYLETPGADPANEPLTLRLDGFDCVSLIETALAAVRVARGPVEGDDAVWQAFAREVERQRYRDGTRDGYLSRLHYFSEWIADGERRGLVRDLGRELGGTADTRPLRFMSENRELYPALRSESVYHGLRERERALDRHTRWVVPAGRIDEIADRVRPGDVIALVSTRAGLDVLHTGLAYRDAAGTLRMIHAPLSGGAVEITPGSLQRYVRSVRGSTGILVARPAA